MDSLLSMVQMPRGVAVACQAIGEPGAYNAGLTGSSDSSDLRRSSVSLYSALAIATNRRCPTLGRLMRIAIVGCGQLARMLALAGWEMGHHFSFLSGPRRGYRCVEGSGAGRL